MIKGKGKEGQIARVVNGELIWVDPPEPWTVEIGPSTHPDREFDIVYIEKGDLSKRTPEKDNTIMVVSASSEEQAELLAISVFYAELAQKAGLPKEPNGEEEHITVRWQEGPKESRRVEINYGPDRECEWFTISRKEALILRRKLNEFLDSED